MAELLPVMPDDLVTAVDRARARVRKSSRKRSRLGYRQIACVMHGDDIDFLMQTWQFETQAQMLRIAMRYLIDATRCGLMRIEVDDDRDHNDYAEPPK